MKFRETLARFLYGRYGTDELYNALFVAERLPLCLRSAVALVCPAGFVFSVISVSLYLLALGMLIWAMFRFFSRNISKRRRENQIWLGFLSRFKRKKKPVLPPDTATHIFRACPKCRSILRLPREVGKHTVKCPRCARKFGVKVQ